MVCRGNIPPAGKVQGENGSLFGTRPTHALEELMGEPAPAKGERSVLPLEEHQRWSLDRYMRAVTARRSDGPRPCRNNAGWRSVLLSDAAVTMPRHAVIAVSLPVGLNTGHWRRASASGRAKHHFADAVPIRPPKERRFLQALIPDREEPLARPGSVMRVASIPSGWNLVPLCGSTDLPSIPGILVTSRLPPPAASRVRFSFHQLTGGIHHRYQLVLLSQSPCPISPQGVRQAPHSRQQVTLCTWPLPFGDLASASWQ